MGGEELKWRQLAHNQLISPQEPYFSPHSTAKSNDKTQISGRMVSSGINVVTFTLVYPEKTCLKKLMIMIIIIMNKSQETTLFHWRQKLTSAMKLRPE